MTVLAIGAFFIPTLTLLAFALLGTFQSTTQKAYRPIF